MISIVLTTHNGEKYIIEQLESIINQSLKPNEILIGDDNSTDATLDLIINYLKNNSIKFYIDDKDYIKDGGSLIIRIFKNNTNIGFNKNFINLIKKTAYDIIFISDQDDLWYKDKIKTQYNLLISKNAICVSSNYDLENNNDKELKELSFQEISIKNINHISFYGMTMCFRKDKEFLSFIEYMLKDTSYLYYDRLFTLYFIIKGKVYLINNPLVYHRIHDLNVVGNNTKNIRGSLEDRVKIAYDYYNDIEFIKKHINNISDSTLFYLNINENFRYKRYLLLNELNNNNTINNKIKLFIFILTNFINYPYTKSIFGDLYYNFK